MRVYDNSSLHEMHGLLQQMKALHGPDRCEGFKNDSWQTLQKRVFNVKETVQDKIIKKWKENSSEHKTLLKKLTSGFRRNELWEICKEVDPSRKPTCAEIALNEFIDECKAKQLQQMFDKLIVQFEWRGVMEQQWNIT
jgi:hypothetical protein